jgi:hypothetical protein
MVKTIFEKKRSMKNFKKLFAYVGRFSAKVFLCPNIEKWTFRAGFLALKEVIFIIKVSREYYAISQI